MISKTSSTYPLVSFILPVYNCTNELADGIPILIEYLDSFLSSYEIIVVDDGSDDAASIQQVCNAFKCTCYRLPVNKGKGYAIRHAVANCNGDIIVFMDGDFPFELASVETMIAMLMKKDADIVIGDRSLPGSIISESLSTSRKLASKLLSFLLKGFNITNFRDTQCGLKGFRNLIKQDVFPGLKEDRFGFDIEFIYQSQRKRYKILSVPVKVIDQKSTSVKVIKDGWDIFRLTVRLFLHKRRSK